MSSVLNLDWVWLAAGITVAAIATLLLGWSLFRDR